MGDITPCKVCQGPTISKQITKEKKLDGSANPNFGRWFLECTTCTYPNSFQSWIDLQVLDQGVVPMHIAKPAPKQIVPTIAKPSQHWGDPTKKRKVEPITLAQLPVPQIVNTTGASLIAIHEKLDSILSRLDILQETNNAIGQKLDQIEATVFAPKPPITMSVV